jgi:prepilin-type N-terminal cleavage/methylation domain-containing protein
VTRLRLGSRAGFTIPEMLVVLAIIGVVTTALVQLFVSASRTQVDMSNRFESQQEGRLALDTLRREIHCASAISSTQTGGTWSPGTTAVKITLGSYCSGAPSGGGDVTWCTALQSTGRYQLRRVYPALAVGATCAGGVIKADYLLTDQVFSGYTASGSGLRAKVSVNLPIDVKPASGQTTCTTDTIGCYRLTDDIVLRNTPRT